MVDNVVSISLLFALCSDNSTTTTRRGRRAITKVAIFINFNRNVLLQSTRALHTKRAQKLSPLATQHGPSFATHLGPSSSSLLLLSLSFALSVCLSLCLSTSAAHSLRLALFHYLSLSTWVRRLALLLLLPLLPLLALLLLLLLQRLRWFIFPLSRCNIIRHKYIRRSSLAAAARWQLWPGRCRCCCCWQAHAQGCNISYIVKWASSISSSSNNPQ